MRRNIVVIVLAALLIVLAAAGVSAQEEITLAGLAEQLAALVTRVEALEDRLNFTGPGKQSGECLIATRQNIDRDTMAAYLDTFEGATPPSVLIQSVVRNGDNITVTYVTYNVNRYVKEYFTGCEFVGHSDWWK